MKKLVLFLVLALGILQYGFSQAAFVSICQGDSYTWHFDTSPTSQVIIRAMKPGSITYDTINSNQIVLSPQEYTIYDIISINGISYTCNDPLYIEVIDVSPTVSINNQDLSISVTSNLDYPIALFIHITDYDNTLFYRYYSQTGATINVDNIPPGNYKLYITTEDSNCRTIIPITIP
ncbi:MAG: hypothetical protein IJQ94_02095 [Bacteroidales bacterium]|nr:hypothetical protein [Bacteroidales bacterium]